MTAGRPPCSAPRPISPDDRLGRFDCGHPALNDFLRKRALGNEGKASRTYVVLSRDGEVVAYYTLATGGVDHGDAPGALERNMPNPLPVMVLGRMAVDLRLARKGLGKGMMREAMQRVLEASVSIGARAMVVHAVDDEAVAFYTPFGFQAFPAGGRTLFLPIETLAAALRKSIPPR